MKFSYANGSLDGFLPAEDRSLVRSKFSEDPVVFNKNEFAANTTDAFGGDVAHFYYSKDNHLEGVEFFPGCEFFFHGVQLLDRKVIDVLGDLRDINIFPVQDDLGFTLEEGRLGLYVSDEGEGEMVKSVYVGMGG